MFSRKLSENAPQRSSLLVYCDNLSGREIPDYKVFIFFAFLSFIWCMFTITCANFLNDFQVGDFAIFSALGLSVEKGLVLFRDVFDHKGPLQFFIYAFAHYTGCFKFTVFMLEVIACTIDLFFIYKITGLFRLRGWACYLPIIVFPFLLYATAGGGGRPECYSLPLTFSFLYFVLKCVEEEHNLQLWQWFLAGIFIGIHFMLKANNAAITCGLIIAVCILSANKMNFLEILKKSIVLFAGFLVLLFPFYVYFQRCGSLQYFLDATFLHNLKYATDSYKNGASFWTQLFINTMPSLISFFVLYKTYTKNNHTVMVVIFSVILTGTLNMIIGRGFFYYYISYIPVIIMTVILCAIYFNRLNDRCVRVIFICLVGFSFINYAMTSVRLVPYTFCFNFYPQGHRLTRINEEQVKEASLLRKSVPAEDYRSFWSYDVAPQIYPLSGLVPSIRYCILQSFQSKWNDDIPKYISEQLQSNPPKWIAIPYSVKDGKVSIDVGHKELKQLLHTEYELYEVFPKGLKTSLYRRKL